MRCLLCAVLAGFLLLTTFSAPSTAQPGLPQPGITTHLLLQTTTTITGQPLEFPHSRNEVAAFLIQLAPGGETGNMLHFFPMVVYVIEGPLSLEVPGQAPRTIEAGQAIAAPIKAPVNGANRGVTPVKFLAVYFGERETPLVKNADSRPRGFRMASVLETVKTWTGEPISFPLLANQFTVQVVDIAPGAATVRQVAQPIQFVYILEGALSLDAGGYPRRVWNRGEGYVETTWPHAGGNRGTSSLRYLAISAGEVGVPLTVPLP